MFVLTPEPTDLDENRPMVNAPEPEFKAIIPVEFEALTTTSDDILVQILAELRIISATLKSL